jgi:lysophospholipase L1-like esterase
MISRSWTGIRIPLAAMVIALLAFGTAFAQPPKHVLVYGDSNSWGWMPQQTGAPSVRYNYGERWPDVMAKKLGADFVVSVDALPCRTVDLDYAQPQGNVPGDQLNGLRTLPAAIAREMPVDIVVIMLGTNDVRSDFNQTPEEIAAGIKKLVDAVHASKGGVFTTYPAPQVLIVVPPYVEDTSKTPFDAVMNGAQAKSRRLAAAVVTVLQGTDATVVDAGNLVTAHGIDGIHLTIADHKAFGEKLAAEVRRALAVNPVLAR